MSKITMAISGVKKQDLARMVLGTVEPLVISFHRKELSVPKAGEDFHWNVSLPIRSKLFAARLWTYVEQEVKVIDPKREAKLTVTVSLVGKQQKEKVHFKFENCGFGSYCKKLRKTAKQVFFSLMMARNALASFWSKEVIAQVEEMGGKIEPFKLDDLITRFQGGKIRSSWFIESVSDKLRLALAGMIKDAWIERASTEEMRLMYTAAELAVDLPTFFRGVAIMASLGVEFEIKQVLQVLNTTLVAASPEQDSASQQPEVPLH